MSHIHSDELYDHSRGDSEDAQKYWANKKYGGWEHLIRPCINRAIEMGHGIQQIKAKFGSLRFYWFPKTIDELGIPVQVKDDEMNKLVSDAEARSYFTCTSCGLEDETIEMGHCKLCKDGWIDRLGDEFSLKRKV